MNKLLSFFSALAFCSLVSGCALHGNTDHSVDTFEGYNRAMFKFNYQVDKYILRPVAEGYRAITNQPVRESIRGVLSNVREPLSSLNHLLQGDIKGSGISLSRFVVNTTLGLGGLFDVAEGWGLKKDTASFNQTLAKWCIKDGPYIVLPFIGPATARSTAGWLFEIALDPVYWATQHNGSLKDRASISYGIMQAVTLKEVTMVVTDDLERNSVDYYTTMRSAYLQNQKKLKCFNDTTSETDNYDFDFGIDDEDEVYNDMEAQDE